MEVYMTPEQTMINQKCNELFRLIEQEGTKFLLKDLNRSLKDSEKGEILVTVASNYLIYCLGKCIESKEDRELVMDSIEARMNQVLPSVESEEVLN